MATKTKTKAKEKTKIKDSLRKVFLNELKEKKEEEREVRVKENAHLKEITVYSDKKLPYAQAYINHLENEGIKVKTIDISDSPTEWAHIRTLTNLASVPAVVVNKTILLMRRDFTNQKQLLQLVKHFANPDFKTPDFESHLFEITKTNIHNIMTRIGQLEQKLTPIIGFVNNLQKQLAEEEKEANEQKNQ